MSCVLSLWLGCSCRAGYLFRYWGSRSKKTPRNHDSNNHRGSTFKHKLGSPSSRHINAAQTDEGQAYLCKKRTECDFRRLQPLSHNWTSVTDLVLSMVGWVRVVLPSCCLELEIVSPFLLWDKWNSHPIFTLKLYRYGMNEFWCKLRVKLPQFDLWLRVTSIVKITDEKKN